MTSRAWGVAGLLTGAIAGFVVIAAVALLPDPRLVAASPTPSPSTAASAPGGSGPPSSSGPSSSLASGSPSPGGSAAPSGSPVASAGASTTVMHIGERAPVLAVQLAAGGFLDLAELRGKPVWIVFVTTGCSACADQVPALNDFQSRYAPNGLTILAIDVSEDAGTVSAFARRTGATFTFGLDLDGSAQRDWGILNLPSHIWIDATGTIRDAAEGAIGPDAMVHGLAQILPGVTVTP